MRQENGTVYGSWDTLKVWLGDRLEFKIANGTRIHKFFGNGIIADRHPVRQHKKAAGARQLDQLGRGHPKKTAALHTGGLYIPDIPYSALFI